MFFRLVAAMVTADAIDRHIREQRHDSERDDRVAPAVTAPPQDATSRAWLEAPERPC